MFVVNVNLTMLKRPSVNDDDDEILRQQEEFFKQKSQKKVIPAAAFVKNTPGTYIKS